MSGKTVLFSSTVGDITFPITPTSIDAMTVGAGTPAAGTFTNLSASGTAAFTGGTTSPAATALTAGTTHTLAGATLLVAGINNVTVVANASDAVALPAAIPGQAIVVFNGGAHLAKVWPQAADAIDGGSAGVAVSLTNALRCIYYCVAANTWISAQLGVVSA